MPRMIDPCEPMRSYCAQCHGGIDLDDDGCFDKVTRQWFCPECIEYVAYQRENSGIYIAAAEPEAE